MSFSEARVLRIETKQAPRPSQPEVVLSDGMIYHHIVNIEYFHSLFDWNFLHELLKVSHA